MIAVRGKRSAIEGGVEVAECEVRIRGHSVVEVSTRIDESLGVGIAESLQELGASGRRRRAEGRHEERLIASSGCRTGRGCRGTSASGATCSRYDKRESGGEQSNAKHFEPPSGGKTNMKRGRADSNLTAQLRTADPLEGRGCARSLLSPPRT